MPDIDIETTERRMMRMLVCMVLAGCLAGCGSNKLAESDLNRIYGLQGDLAENHLEIEQKMLSFMAAEMLRRRGAEAKLEVPECQAIIDEFVAGHIEDMKSIDAIRHQIVFLAIQSERLKALTMSLNVYIQGKKGIIELMRENKE